METAVAEDDAHAPEGLGEESNQDDAPQKPVPSTNPNAWRPSLVAALLMTLISVALNWPYQYVEKSVTGSADLFVDLKLQGNDVVPIMAGWPFRYSISYPATERLPQHSLFSTSALVRNVGLVILVISLVSIYLYRRNRFAPVSSKRTFRITIGDLLMLTLLAAAPFGYWQWLGRSYEQTAALAQSIRSSESSVLRSAWVPKFLGEHLPPEMLKRLQKVRKVRFENPSSELVQRAIAIPTLTSFRVGGGDYNIDLLQQLGQKFHLQDLRISGRGLDTQTIQVIASLKRLKTLNLMRTNVTTEAVHALNALPALRMVQLMHTDVELKTLGTPKWSETVEFFGAPLPPSGTTDELVIDGWPELTTLHIGELDTQLNPKTMKVQLANLPKLETIGLDQFQKFDLEARDLPSLKRMEGTAKNWNARLPRGGTVPGGLWLERFAGSGLPNLEDLKFFCVDLKSFSLQGPTKISSLGAGVFYRSLNQAVQNNPYEKKLGPEAATALIKGLGKSHGPVEIDLDAVPLSGVDLSPLAGNTDLRRLLLANSGTKIDQWKQLADMKWLTGLRLSYNPIDREGLAWIIKSFPNLETLEYGTDMMEQMRVTGGTRIVSWDTTNNAIDFSGHETLKTIIRHGDQFQMIDSVRIVDMPQLEMDIDVSWPETLVIRNSPRITGLSVQGPFPPTAELDQQSNLSYFAVGGPTVTDKVVRSVLDSHQISILTLAYPNVSSEVISQLPVANLLGLYLPGCQLTDEVLDAWPKMASVAYLNLADTQITAAGLEKLLPASGVKSLVLDRCPIDQSNLSILAKHLDLETLSVVNIGISASTLTSLLQEGDLVELDLSGSTISDELLGVIADYGSGLRHLSLRDSEFSNTEFASLARRRSKITFDLSGSTVATTLEASLISGGRIKTKRELQEERAFNEYVKQRSSYQMAGAYSSFTYQPPSKIAVEDFASDGPYSANGMSSNASDTGPGGNILVAPGSSPPNATSKLFKGVLQSFFGTAEEAEDTQPTETEENEPTSTDVSQENSETNQ